MRYIIVLATLSFTTWSFVQRPGPPINADQSIAQLLEVLGDAPIPHKVKKNLDNVSVQRGMEIVKFGHSNTLGKKSRRQSKHFTCLACHNIEREDEDLSDPNPESRLSYVSKHQLPFLQGSPLFGIVNRRKFYNGDYEKKYGTLVEPARNDIREAIQLCAVECSQGRRLKDWEVESVLAYLWTLELKVKDLELSEEEMRIVGHAFDTGKDKKHAISILKSKYMEYSPATFVAPPDDRQTGDGLKGNALTGHLIYKHSCQHCHYDNQYSFLLLDNSKSTFEHLLKEAGTYHPHSLYQVVRYGTPPKGGKEAYMPQYTKEKMTDQQLADLRAYIEAEAGN